MPKYDDDYDDECDQKDDHHHRVLLDSAVSAIAKLHSDSSAIYQLITISVEGKIYYASNLDDEGLGADSLRQVADDLDGQAAEKREGYADVREWISQSRASKRNGRTIH